MTQDDHWKEMWKAYMDFLAKNKRRPSKYNPENMKLVNWLKHNRKLRNKGILPDNRKDLFLELLAKAAKYQRVNQHSYVNMPEDASHE